MCQIRDTQQRAHTPQSVIFVGVKPYKNYLCAIANSTEVTTLDATLFCVRHVMMMAAMEERRRKKNERMECSKHHYI